MHAKEASSLSLLKDARDRAERLSRELRVQQADLEKKPQAIAADQLEQGRAALQNAIDAADRMLQELNAALTSALTSQ